MIGRARDLYAALGATTYVARCDRELKAGGLHATRPADQPVDALTPQETAVAALVASGLSTAGYVTVAAIMGLDNILDQLEGWSVDFGRERGRDPLLYYITIFSEPGGGAPWGWRFGGHHVSLHYTIIGGEVVASTPNFLGADPAVSPLLGPQLMTAVKDVLAGKPVPKRIVTEEGIFPMETAAAEFPKRKY